MIFPLLLAATAANASMMEDASVKLHRVHISDMSCDEVHDALQDSRKALLTWHSKSGRPRYGMYIASDGWCKGQQYKSRQSVGTTDMKWPNGCQVIQCNNPSRPPSR